MPEVCEVIRPADPSPEATERILSKREEELLIQNGCLSLLIQTARDQWHGLKRGYRRFGATLNSIKAQMEKLEARHVSDEEIAERLELDLTGQAVGQIRLTVEKFGDLIDDKIPFEAYRVARQLDKDEHTPKELAKIVKKNPSVKAIRQAFKPKDERLEIPHRFCITSSGFEQSKDNGGDGHWFSNVVKVTYDGKTTPELNDDDANYGWICMAAKAASAAIAAVAARASEGIDREIEKKRSDFKSSNELRDAYRELAERRGWQIRKGIERMIHEEASKHIRYEHIDSITAGVIVKRILGWTKEDDDRVAADVDKKRIEAGLGPLKDEREKILAKLGGLGKPLEEKVQASEPTSGALVGAA